MVRASFWRCVCRSSAASNVTSRTSSAGELVNRRLLTAGKRPPYYESVLSVGNDFVLCAAYYEEYGVPDRRIYWTLGEDRQILVLIRKSSAIFTSAANDPATIFSIM